MRIPLAVYCVIRRARPTNSKFHPPKVDFTRRVGVPRKVADFFGVLVDGFDCAILRLEYHAKSAGVKYFVITKRLFHRYCHSARSYPLEWDLYRCNNTPQQKAEIHFQMNRFLLRSNCFLFQDSRWYQLRSNKKH